MRIPLTSRFFVAAALALGTGLSTLSIAASAGAAGVRDFHEAQSHALFVETDNAAGNTVLSYHRALDGSVSLHGTYATGGLGGSAVGASADPLASQGGLMLSNDAQRLVATNAGSNTLSVFSVEGARLNLIQTIGSGGVFPVSLTSHGNLVAVLNSAGTGSIAEFQWWHGQLVPVNGAVRSLGLSNTTPPFFTAGPGQVGYTPDGTQLIVADKTSTNGFQTFSVSPNGQLGATAVASPAQHAVPFSFVFDAAGHLVATEASTSSVSTYQVNPNGTLSAISSVSDGAKALCWISSARGFFFGSNAASATVSSFGVDASGNATLLNATAATTHAGTTDSVASSDGNYLYVESGGAGALDVFAVSATGALTPVETLWNIPVASEGLAVS